MVANYSPFAISPFAVKSALADNRDEIVARRAAARARAAGRNGAGDVVAVDFAERQRLREIARLAVRIRHRRAARRAGGEAAVDAVAVGIVGDDEDALFRLCGSRAEEHQGSGGDHETHEIPPNGPKRPRIRVPAPTMRRPG